jgi:alginate O-acetyltransferase complex protein AlgI
MVFASLSFLLVFFPISLFFYVLFKNIKIKNIILILFSLVFYSWGEPTWVFLLLLTTMVDFQMAKLMEKYEDSPKSKLLLWLSLFLSIGALIFFKYTGFIIQNINFFIGTSIHVPKIEMPIGISFYTFQSVSYMVDVYNGKVKAQKNYCNYLLFISLFHQLIAGPIVRYSDIEKQIESRRVSLKDVSDGVNRFIFGLFKKVFFANSAAVLVEGYFKGDISQLSVIECLLGLTFFAIQLYYDFSGYSDMAIGMGRMIGFNYFENFHFPYSSKSIKEFWSRWHISLGTFLKDYVFNPISFKHKKWGKLGLVYSLFLTFFISGLWHGASWNFILWGLYFALLIMIEEWFLIKWMSRLGAWIQHMYLIVAVVMSYAFFYFADNIKLIQFFFILFGKQTPLSRDGVVQLLASNSIWLIASIFFLFPWGNYILNYFIKKFSISDSIVMSVKVIVNICLLLVSISFLVAKSYNPFLYFRF